MGSVLENMPSKIFEDEGFDERACTLLELHLSSLKISLRILIEEMGNNGRSENEGRIGGGCCPSGINAFRYVVCY